MSMTNDNSAPVSHRNLTNQIHECPPIVITIDNVTNSSGIVLYETSRKKHIIYYITPWLPVVSRPQLYRHSLFFVSFFSVIL